MKFFFIPGRLPNLSLAELKVVCNTFLPSQFTINSQSHNYFILDTQAELEKIHEIFQRLGGFIKFGALIEDQEKFLENYTNAGKVTFGVSAVPFSWDFKHKGLKPQKLAREIKKSLKENGVDGRFIEPKGRDVQLTSGQIVQNKLLDKGFELLLLEEKDGALIPAQTLGVQDIESFSMRDYGRPDVDTEMGMLPPKLARIMVNLLGLRPEAKIWDPFCGSGTILLEALLLGYDVLGSDVDQEAVKSSEKNIEWLSKNAVLGDTKYSVFRYDITRFDKRLYKKMKTTGIDGVVFEPFMGPPQKRLLPPYKAEKLALGVEKLLKEAFVNIESILKPRGRVVAVVPSYKMFRGWKSVRYTSFLGKKWEILSDKIGGKDLHWSRSNSIIRRNILIARLKG